ncbi:MAG: hypothetical protein L3J34_00370 [Flavobacteriaceae bacterium]|nr:hypothetical protein [Flavobacteriaceae bacterium]
MKKTILFIIAVSIHIYSYSQTINAIEPIKIPQEKIYLHHNDTFFLTGEYIYYKVYCLNDVTDKLSDFSKIAYVVLVNSESNEIFKHKITLDYGVGQGDFFIPSSVLSGNYKIIAYTQWMKNTSIDNFYQNDISIINPFQSDQKNILPNEKEVSVKTVTLEKGKIDKSISKLNTNGTTFGSRDKVTIALDDLMNSTKGNYSISVKKIEPLKTPKRNTAIQFAISNSQKENIRTNTNKSNIVIPELRGEMLMGKVFFKDTNKPAENIKVALSIPGKNYIFKVSNTNKLGVFYFNLIREYENKNALIQIIDKHKDQYDFNFTEPAALDYSTLNFEQFIITPAIDKLILQHSISNQIENAYADVKQDSLVNIKITPPFFNKPTYEYILDDYTRFSTVKETILEVIEQASIRKSKEDFFIHVRVYDDNVESSLKSLLLVDGIFVQNHNDIVNSKSSSIKKISLVNEQYVYGSQVFEGIILLETFDGNYNKLPVMHVGKKIKLFKPIEKKKYFNQVYDSSNNLDRIPDYRSQLVWEPNFNLNKDSSYSFYTSDLKGDFEICIEGFNENGLPVSISKIIKVE